MRPVMKRTAVALTFAVLGGNLVTQAASAAECAGTGDMMAIRAAAVQQQLMVAAFSCQSAENYNKFVLKYRKELQTSDGALQDYFKRSNARTGTADYHAFKTRLANNSSMQSINDTAGYCANARATFEDVLSAGSLSVLLADHVTAAEDGFKPCQLLTVQGGKPTVRE